MAERRNNRKWLSYREGDPTAIAEPDDSFDGSGVMKSWKRTAHIRDSHDLCPNDCA